MLSKMIDFGKNDVLNITRENIQKYFLELDPLYIKDGPAVKQVHVFKARSLTPFEKDTHYAPIVGIGQDRYVPLEKVQNLIAY